MNHLCDHAEFGSHQCLCGLEADHTSREYVAWAMSRGLIPLDSEVK